MDKPEPETKTEKKPSLVTQLREAGHEGLADRLEEWREADNRQRAKRKKKRKAARASRKKNR